MIPSVEPPADEDPAPPDSPFVGAVANTLLGERPVLPAPNGKNESNGGYYHPIAVGVNGALISPEAVNVPASFDYPNSKAIPPFTELEALADPLAALPDPDLAALNLPLGNGGRPMNISGNSKVTLTPGDYRKITTAGNAVVTFAAGTYVLREGMEIGGRSRVTGDDVQFIFVPPAIPSGFNFSKTISSLVDRLPQFFLCKDTASFNIQGPRAAEKHAVFFWMRGLTGRVLFGVRATVPSTEFSTAL